MARHKELSDGGKWGGNLPKGFRTGLVYLSLRATIAKNKGKNILNRGKRGYIIQSRKELKLMGEGKNGPFRMIKEADLDFEKRG